MRSAVRRWRGLVAVVVAGGALGVGLWSCGGPRDPAPAKHAVVVVVEAPGLASEKIEEQIVVPLERALAGVPRVAAARAIAVPGAAVLAWTFASDDHARAARAEVAARLAGVTLPEGASARLAAPGGRAGGELAYALRGETLSPLELRDLQDWVVRPQLLSEPGVVDVRSCGGALTELSIRVEPERLARFGVAIDDVVAATSSASAPRLGDGATIETLRQEVVAERHGAVVRVGDVAEIVRGPAPVDCEVVRARASPIVAGFVEIGTADAVRAIGARLREIGPALPRGVSIEVLWQRPPLRLRVSMPPLPPAERSRVAAALAGRLGDLDATVVTGELRDGVLPGELVIHVARARPGPSDRPIVAAVEAVLVLHGGGNFGDWYPEYQALRESVVAHCPERRIVMLPQSLHFRDAAAQRRSLAHLLAHRDLHLFLRDAESLEAVRAHAPDRGQLLPDMAHALWRTPGWIAPPAPAGAGTLRLRRRDDEALRGALPDSFDWPDLVGPGDLLAFRALRFAMHRNLDRRHRLAARGWQALSQRLVTRARQRFVAHEAVATDRLHGMILAALLERPAHYLDNRYGKLSRYARAWLGDSPWVRAEHGGAPSPLASLRHQELRA